MRRSESIPDRGGYALLMCLMVVGVTSSILLTLFSGLRLQTAESLARRQIVINHALADGAFEHGLAVLLDTPDFSGQIHQSVPTQANCSYQLDIQQGPTAIQMTLALQTGAVASSYSRTYSSAALQQRRLTLGLN